jgi:hypothetical protein
MEAIKFNYHIQEINSYILLQMDFQKVFRKHKNIEINNKDLCKQDAYMKKGI